MESTKQIYKEFMFTALELCKVYNGDETKQREALRKAFVGISDKLVDRIMKLRSEIDHKVLENWASTWV